MDKLEGFAGFFGADFYGLPRNREKISLTKTPIPIPAQLKYGEHSLVPFRAGENIAWQIE